MRPLPLRFALLAAGLLLAIGGARAWTERGDGRLHLIIPAIPGDGFLLRTPEDRFILIDGGADGTLVANWLGQELPLGRRTLDLMIGTRADETTLPGQLAAARRYHITSALLTAPAKPNPSWEELLRLLADQRAAVQITRPGDRLRLGAGPDDTPLMIEVLAVVDGHALIDLRSGQARIGLLQSLAGEPLPALTHARQPTVLLYPWRRSTDDPGVRALAPGAIVFSERAGDDPRQTLAERRVGTARLLHEALTGRIDIAFDDDGIQVDVQREDGQ